MGANQWIAKRTFIAINTYLETSNILGQQGGRVDDECDEELLCTSTLTDWIYTWEIEASLTGKSQAAMCQGCVKSAPCIRVHYR